MLPKWVSILLECNAALDFLIFLAPEKIAVRDLLGRRLPEKPEGYERLDQGSKDLVDVALKLGAYAFLTHGMVRLSAGLSGTLVVCRMAVASYIIELIQALVMVKKGHMAVKDFIPVAVITIGMCALTAFFGRKEKQ
mmetsp:Transcript_53867/g.108150  ORF Transcript_53867/g.108150 Transcript_53867/m.108150 type:complete len:137 (-) Transcript_53867:157-567(-)